MKALVLVLLLAASATFSFGQLTEKVIGVNENNIYKITTNLPELKLILENQLAREGNATILSKFYIKKDTLERANPKEYFLLLAQNKVGSIKLAVDLELKGSLLIARYSRSIKSFSSYVTCFGGCINGCYPKKATTLDGNIYWICNTCPDRPEGCKKSVTTNSF
jgi:hypothetical protein